MDRRQASSSKSIFGHLAARVRQPNRGDQVIVEAGQRSLRTTRRPARLNRRRTSRYSMRFADAHAGATPQPPSRASSPTPTAAVPPTPYPESSPTGTGPPLAEPTGPPRPPRRPHRGHIGAFAPPTQSTAATIRSPHRRPHCLAPPGRGGRTSVKGLRCSKPTPSDVDYAAGSCTSTATSSSTGIADADRHHRHHRRRGGPQLHMQGRCRLACWPPITPN